MKKNLSYIFIIIFLLLLICALLIVLISMHKDAASTITNSVPEVFSKEQIIPQTPEPINITPLPPSGTAATTATTAPGMPGGSISAVLVPTHVGTSVDPKDRTLTKAQEPEENPPEYKEFLKYGIKPREAKYYELSSS